MNLMYFEELLISSVWSHIFTCAILFCLILVLLIANFISYKRKKTDFALWRSIPIFNYTKSKLTIKEQIVMQCIGLIVLLIIMMVKVLPVCRDISREQYICQYATYQRTLESSDTGGLFSDGYVKITVEGEQFRLNLPKNWSASEFPEGTHEGYICYSESSKYILDFDPAE